MVETIFNSRCPYSPPVANVMVSKTNIIEFIEPSERDKLMILVYGELRRLANIYLQRERTNHTLQPTALVHEAYLRLVEQVDVRWQNREHFMGLAASIMRRVLVDYAPRIG